MNIYVASINFKTTESQLRELFQQFGTVDSVKIITDKTTHESRGFGFVEMPNSSEAEDAIQKLNKYSFQGRNLAVNEARPQESRSGDNRKPNYSGNRY